jgi:Tfp pilus assembly protein PilE
MSPTLIKFLVAVGGVLLIGTLAFVIYNQIQLRNQQTAIQTQLVEQRQLVDGIVRSQNQYATKADVEKFAKDNGINLGAIKDDLEKLHAEVTAVNVAVTHSNGQHGNNLPNGPPGPVNPNPVDPKNPDPYGYMKAQQSFALDEDFGTVKIPFGKVGFSAWQEKPWSVDVNSREYKLSTVVGTDENQRQYFYNKFSIATNGKTYDVPITTATTKQEYPTAKWSWWNPRLLMGLDGGVNITQVKGEFTPHIGIGIMSYGQYKTTPDFSILEVGIGYGTINKTAQVVITPVAYNIGKNLFSPLMNNTYIAPSLSIGTDGSLGVGAGLRVGF